MSEMVERVARSMFNRRMQHSRALQILGQSGGWEVMSEEMYGLAINAIVAMREPTEAMVSCLAGREESEDERAEGWRCAIDAALGEQE